MNIFPILPRIALATALLSSVVSLHAHQLWVGSNNYMPSFPGARMGPITVYVYATFGHRLPLDEPIDDTRFGGIYLHAPGAAAVLLPSSTDSYRAAPLKIEKPGAYMVSSINKPIFSTQMKDEQGVISYARVPRNEAPARANVVDSTHIHGFTKTLIYAKGDGAEYTSAVVTKPIGHTLELVPAKNPATATPGEMIPIQVLLNGKPYIEEPIEILAEHVAAPHLGKSGRWIGETDRQGRVNVPAGVPGVWMLLATVIQPTTGELKAKANQIRYRTTFTYEIPGTTYSY